MTGFPTSYTSNSETEKDLLILADNFRRQFDYLFPHRPTPSLYIENECGVRKLVSTTLCPSALKKTTELVQWQDCACFVSDSFQQDSLESPLEGPRRLPSMGVVLKRRRGNSLDLSMALCTLLLSSGYDAYVVHGYAARDVTEKIERDKGDPLLTLPRKFRRYEALFRETPSSEPEGKGDKYYVDLARAKKYWMEGVVEDPPVEPEKRATVAKVEEDPLLGRRVHFWVMLLKTENDSFQSTFLEATTGEVMPLDSEKYTGVESVWNDTNFWSNKQAERKGMGFELGDIGHWEVFLLEYQIHKEYRTGKHFLMPETWVRDVEITQREVDERFHPDGKHVRYRTVQIDRYNPGTLRTGLVLRVMYYDGDDPEKTTKAHEFFSGKKDFMEYRITDYRENTVKELFDRGRTDALREHVYYPEGGDRPSFVQTMSFHSHLRGDGLSTMEWSNRAMKEVYEGREDLLFMKEAAYDAEVSFDVEGEEEAVARSSSEESTDSEIGEEMKSEVPPDEAAKEEENAEEEKAEGEVGEPEEKGPEKIEERENAEEGELDECEPEEETDQLSHMINVGIKPVHFESEEPLYVYTDLTKWTYHEFLETIDPAERYATSESDSEDQVPQKISERVENTDEQSRPPTEESVKIESAGSEIPSEENTEQLMEGFQKSQESEGNREGTKEDDSECDASKDNQENSQNTANDSGNTDSVKARSEKNDKLPSKQRERDSADDYAASVIRDGYDGSSEDEEVDVFDDINFDALSDEESEIDYQMYLRKLWNKFRIKKQIDLFYMQREFQMRRDMRKKDILYKKKDIIMKRRSNIRFIQRKEQGSPSVRTYKRKSEESNENRKGLHTNDLIRNLKLRSLNIPDVSDLTEFYEIKNLDEKYIKDAEEEIIQSESLKLMKLRLINFLEEKKHIDKHLLWVKRSFLRNNTDSSIKTIWYMFDSKTYRIDYYPTKDKCSSRTLIFTKPITDTTRFPFNTYLCRQIIPAHETTKITKARLYSHLVSLIRNEKIVLKDHHSSERELKNILKKRSEVLASDEKLSRKYRKHKLL